MDWLEGFKEVCRGAILVKYGSRVYGTHNNSSDHDYQAIVSESVNPTGAEFRQGQYNVHVIDSKDFQVQLNDHKVSALEAYFLSDQLNHFQFKLDLVKLRKEFSAKASNSFVKAKKKIEVEKDYLVGWKSLFHSLRILDFGRQIAENSKIIDFSSANHYWHDILSISSYTWEPLKTKYQPIYNSLATEFRKLAPLDTA